jgi:hypothetical protein
VRKCERYTQIGNLKMPLKMQAPKAALTDEELIEHLRREVKNRHKDDVFKIGDAVKVRDRTGVPDGSLANDVGVVLDYIGAAGMVTVLGVDVLGNDQPISIPLGAVQPLEAKK